MIVDDAGNEFLVVDAHVHVGTRPFTSTGTPNRAGGDFLADELIQSMDAAGVDMAVIFPRANPNSDYVKENELVLRAAEQYADRLIPYVRVQPYFPSAADAIPGYAKRGARGVKIHPFMDFGGNGVNRPDMIYPIVEAAVGSSMLLQIHSGESWNAHPTLIWDLAMTFPKGTFVIAHCGLWEGHQAAIALARRTPNLYMDTAEVAPPAVIWSAVQGVGSDRLLFGSDQPAIPYGFEIGKVMKYAGLGPAELQLIMADNLVRLLGLEIDRTSRRRVQLRDL